MSSAAKSRRNRNFGRGLGSYPIPLSLFGLVNLTHMNLSGVRTKVSGRSSATIAVPNSGTYTTRILMAATAYSINSNTLINSAPTGVTTAQHLKVHALSIPNVVTIEMSVENL